MAKQWFIHPIVSKTAIPSSHRGVPLPPLLSELLLFFVLHLRCLLVSERSTIQQIWISSNGNPLGKLFTKTYLKCLDGNIFNRYVLDAIHCWFPDSKMTPADWRRLVPSLLFEETIQDGEDPDKIIGDYAELVQTSKEVC